MDTIRVMIVDDDRSARDRMERLLGTIENISIIAIESHPNKAIERILSELPDIVFIDVEMPEMTGFEVVKEVRKFDRDVTFIFATGYNQYAIKAIKLEAFDYLLKPIDIDELKESIYRYKAGNIKGNEAANLQTEQKYIERYKLSQREIEIIRLLNHGKSSKEISNALFISVFTVNTHRRNILEKTGFKSTTELMLFSIEKGIFL